MLIDALTFTFLKNRIKKDGWLELPASGNSMFPLIQQGNICQFVPFAPSLVKKGDVILFCSLESQLIAHRFVGIKKEQNQTFYYLKGDTNLGLDQPIEEEQILGKLVSVQKHRLKIEADHFIAHFWGSMILSFPVLSGILRKHLNRKMNLQF
ncbi:signal peptidase I [Bacillus sp. EB600]|uniref:signal peptidase I n=1 Tax=Bacillus sp. EB600 TaxID=2806345 RepID=UPI00210AAB37|nr:signal peptidase I [Bacillus sp. EB600]MCQ6278875.1 signal peptidase I [Bacillus sp. EB600]